MPRKCVEAQRVRTRADGILPDDRTIGSARRLSFAVWAGPGGLAGRPKGVPNKATKEVKELAQRLVLDPEYQQKLKQRLLNGTLQPAVEALLWHYSFGKPKDTLDVNVETQRRVINIIEASPSPKTAEPQPEEVPKLALPEDPPVRHLAPVNERRTYGPSIWPTRNSRR